MAAFWDVVQCCMVEIYYCFRHAYYLHHQMVVMEAVSTSETTKNPVSEVLTAPIIRVMMMEAVNASETLVCFYQIIHATSQKTTIFLFTTIRI
jgi:hypothetical protein